MPVRIDLGFRQWLVSRQKGFDLYWLVITPKSAVMTPDGSLPVEREPIRVQMEPITVRLAGEHFAGDVAHFFTFVEADERQRAVQQLRESMGYDVAVGEDGTLKIGSVDCA